MDSAQQLALSHRWLAENVAIRWGRRVPRLKASKEDLVQAGMLGLVEAARRFNPEGPASFRTFAFHAVFNAVAATARVLACPFSVRQGWGLGQSGLLTMLAESTVELEELGPLGLAMVRHGLSLDEEVDARRLAQRLAPGLTGGAARRRAGGPRCLACGGRLSVGSRGPSRMVCGRRCGREVRQRVARRTQLSAVAAAERPGLVWDWWRLEGAPMPERHARSTLQSADVPEVRRRLAAGERPASVARAFGVSRHVIYGISYGHTWRHVA
jgi:hypothetical protein